MLNRTYLRIAALGTSLLVLGLFALRATNSQARDPFAAEVLRVSSCDMPLGRVLAIRENNTLVLSDNAGSNWVNITPDAVMASPNNKMTLVQVATDPNDSNHFIVRTKGAGLYRTIDGGRSWEHHIPPGSGTARGLYLANEEEGTFVYLTSVFGVFRSDSTLANWEKVVDEKNTRHFTICSQFEGTRAYVRYTHDPYSPTELVMTIDGGRSWARKPFSFDVESLAIKNGHVYLVAGVGFGRTSKEVLEARLSDGSIAISSLGTLDGEFSSRSIALSDEGEAFVATQFGVVAQLIDSEEWVAIDATAGSVHSLSLDDSYDRLYVGGDQGLLTIALGDYR